jgi:hypothetical protein
MVMTSLHSNDTHNSLLRRLLDHHERLNNRRKMILKKRCELDRELSAVDAEDSQLCELVAHQNGADGHVGERYARYSLLRAWRVALVILCLASGPALADDVPKAQGKAPPDHEVLKHTRGGVYFVAKPLKEQYDQLLARVSLLKVEIDQNRISGAEARQQLTDLQTQLENLREQIEQRKVLVVPAKVRTQSETTTFDLGPERLLVVTSDNIRLEGWEGPGVRCVLEKTVLSPDDRPVDDHLKGIKLVHRYGRATNLVGATRKEREADDQKFLASPDGQKLSNEQRESRKRFLDEIAGGYDLYREFQGKEIDSLEIEGLTHEQGNRQILIEARSDEGGASLGSDWQRHAALTVFVPMCKAVALRGCQVRLDVKGLHGSLIVTSAGSRDRDYNGVFQIQNVHGSLALENTPIDLVQDIYGNVSITSTVEFANRGTQHENNERRLYTPPPRELVCRNIHGDLTAWFSRSDLKLDGIAGRIDTKNEFGDTKLSVTQPLAQEPQRLISESGRIEVKLSQEALRALPLLAMTNCGAVQTNIPQLILEDRSFTTGRDRESGSRNWHGVMTKKDSRHPQDFLSDFERPGNALRGIDRAPGFDLISRSGTVVVMVER